MLDALSIVMQRPPSSVEKQSVRRVILLLSDGEDNTSRHTLDEVLEVAQREEVAIYAVDVPNPHLEFPGDRVLRSLARARAGACSCSSAIPTQNPHWCKSNQTCGPGML
jgi:hypothetical protein